MWWGNGFALVGYIFKFLHPHTFPHCHKSIYPCTHLHGELYSPRPSIPPAQSPRGVASPVTHIPPALSPRDMSTPKTVLSTSNSICAESAGILIQLTNQLLVFRCCHEHREFVLRTRYSTTYKNQPQQTCFECMLLDLLQPLTPRAVALRWESLCRCFGWNGLQLNPAGASGGQQQRRASAGGTGCSKLCAACLRKQLYDSTKHDLWTLR